MLLSGGFIIPHLGFECRVFTNAMFSLPRYIIHPIAYYWLRFVNYMICFMCEHTKQKSLPLTMKHCLSIMYCMWRISYFLCQGNISRHTKLFNRTLECTFCEILDSCVTTRRPKLLLLLIYGLQQLTWYNWNGIRNIPFPIFCYPYLFMLLCSYVPYVACKVNYILWTVIYFP